jgi:formamidopyrimidine-DNA glycosylase
MPEWPDVAGFKKYLDATSLHQEILRSHVTDERFVKGVSRQGLQRRLKGAELEHSKQWGKWLLVQLSTEGFLVLHFGMTGQLDYASQEEEPHEHTRLALLFREGNRLAVISQRMIGRATWVADTGELGSRHDLGPDAVQLDQETFVGRLKHRRGSIKSALMNQSILAGIGNVYSDEILFQSGLRPDSKVSRLGGQSLRKMHRNMQRILRLAGRKGGNGHKAPRTWLLGHRNAQGQCPKCHGHVKKQSVNSRTAWFCPNCQSRP